MAKIEFEPRVRDALADSLKRHLKGEFDLEIERFDAVALLDFIGDTLGPHFYNQGLRDAQSIISAKAELISEAIWDLELPLPR